MAGKSQPEEKLNSTLELLVKKFEEHGITRWFVSYGTLLGLIRDGSCIGGDDDIDLCVHRDDYDLLKKAMSEMPMGQFYPVRKGREKVFMRREESPVCTPVDLYICQVERGHFTDQWEGVIWTSCYENTSEERMAYLVWRNLKVNIPRDYIQKLEGRYGKTWTKRIERGSPAGDGFKQVRVL